MQLVVLGEGMPKYHSLLDGLASRYPGKLRVFLEFSNVLSHQIEAGADVFLMPSLYEPCGLNQLYSLAYGTIPIVRATGGLADTVIDATPAALAEGKANGFAFSDPTAPALAAAIQRASRSGPIGQPGRRWSVRRWRPTGHGTGSPSPIVGSTTRSRDGGARRHRSEHFGDEIGSSAHLPGLDLAGGELVELHVLDVAVELARAVDLAGGPMPRARPFWRTITWSHERIVESRCGRMIRVRPGASRASVSSSRGLTSSSSGDVRLLDDDDRGVVQGRAGEADPVLLVGRQVMAERADEGVVAVGEVLDELVGMGQLRRLDHARQVVAGVAQADVGEDGVAEDRGRPGGRSRPGRGSIRA